MAISLDRRRLRAADLVYVRRGMPGISRRRRGDGFAYYGPDGRRIGGSAEIDRLKRLGVPPAYEDVWICPLPNGHLQAVGRDERGRIQYRYHLDWRTLRDRGKHGLTLEFGEALPRIRAKVEADLMRRSLDRESIAAAVVRLLDVAHLRVGSAIYADQNGSFGATTLRPEHVIINGGRMELKFKGKSGRKIRRRITDQRLMRIIRRCHELPGQTLFCYPDGGGEVHPVRSDDVNAYLKDIAGENFTAKHFRTWAGSVLAFETIAGLLTRLEAKAITLKEVVEPVAEALGNTPAICRSSYIHPAIIGVLKHGVVDAGDFRGLPRPTKYLSASERGLLRFLGSAGKVLRAA